MSALVLGFAMVFGSAGAHAQAAPCVATEMTPDPTGQADFVTTVRFAYDANGHKLSEQYTYSRAGVPGETSGRRTFTYDPAGRLASEASAMPPPAGADALAYAYDTDAQGRITAVIRRGTVAGEAVDETARRTLDAEGRVAREVLKATTGWTLTTTYRYEADRLVEQVESEGGQGPPTLRQFSYDAEGRRIGQVSTLPDGRVEEVRWTWDGQGRRDTEARLRFGSVVSLTRFTYCP